MTKKEGLDRQTKSAKVGGWFVLSGTVDHLYMIRVFEEFFKD